uniref:Uncharacterized protein n=1 Tax=Brassica campestris TaxID=3711 RepID=A0A3P6D165_BRACM|nr:unnamed protein product [Brassica rapa]
MAKGKDVRVTIIFWNVPVVFEMILRKNRLEFPDILLKRIGITLLVD